jgi:hypothetical protein
LGFVPDVADDSHATTNVFERHPRSTAIVLMTLAAALVLLLGEAIVRIAMPSVNFLGIDRRLFAPAGEDEYGNAPGFSGRAFGAEVRIDREGFRAGGNPAVAASQIMILSGIRSPSAWACRTGGPSSSYSPPRTMSRRSTPR